MDELGKITQLIIPVLGHNITLNLEAILMAWVVITILIIFGYLSARNKNILAGPLQIVGELIVSTLQ